MPTFQQFPLPDAGEGLTEAEIVAWHVAVGDTVEVNQTIVEIETAKSLVELPSPCAGRRHAILLVEPGQTVDVGTPIIEVDTDPHGRGSRSPSARARRRRRRDRARAPRRREPARGRSSPAGPTRSRRPAPARRGAAPAAAAGAPAPVATAVLVGYGVAEAAAAAARRAPDGRRRRTAPRSATATRHALAKPPVRKLARELGVDLDSVTPTGPGGIVTREDVLAPRGPGRGAHARHLPRRRRTRGSASGTVSVGRPPDARAGEVGAQAHRRGHGGQRVHRAARHGVPHGRRHRDDEAGRAPARRPRVRRRPRHARCSSPPRRCCSPCAGTRRSTRQLGRGRAGDRLQALRQPRHRGGDPARARRARTSRTRTGSTSRTSRSRSRSSPRPRARARTTPADMSDGTITITNVGRVRHRHRHADPQPRRGGDPRVRRDPRAAVGAQGQDQDPPRHAARAELRPPAGRRRAGLARAGRRRARCCTTRRTGSSGAEPPLAV